MENYANLCLPDISKLDTQHWDQSVKYTAANLLANIFLKDTSYILPQAANDIALLICHLRPHLDEYLAMLLFRSCLPSAKWDLPTKETILYSTDFDKEVYTDWQKACVFGLSNLHASYAKPLLLFDEHNATGGPKKDSSAVALVYHRLFNKGYLPKPLFFICREIDLLDACGGGHPKHLATYLTRLHDFADGTTLPKLSSGEKQALIEAAIFCILWANLKQFNFWDQKFWRPRVLESLKECTQLSPLRQSSEFSLAVDTVKKNLEHFRQPFFASERYAEAHLCFKVTMPRVLQTLCIPYIVPLLPLVWGDIGHTFGQILWNVRLQGQMQYLHICDVFNKNVGLNLEDGDYTTSIGNLSVRHIAQRQGHPILLVDLNSTINKNNVRSAVLSYVHKTTNCALIINRDAETGILVITRCREVPYPLWVKLVDWLIASEGVSSEETPGCWHIMCNDSGTYADFILNGNASHRYVPRTKLTIDMLADWLKANI